MSCAISKEDREFRRRVDGGQFPVADFDHRAHLRLAYVHRIEGGPDQALDRMRTSILGLLEQAGINPSTKYHETLTGAWVLVVDRALTEGPGCRSADDFIERHPELLDTRLLQRHYSPERLFSQAARERFLPPDLAPLVGA